MSVSNNNNIRYVKKCLFDHVDLFMNTRRHRNEKPITNGY